MRVSAKYWMDNVCVIMVPVNVLFGDVKTPEDSVNRTKTMTLVKRLTFSWCDKTLLQFLEKRNWADSGVR